MKRILSAILCAMLLAVPVGCSAQAQGSAEVLVINVGKADSILVMVDGRAWLIDTGTEESISDVFAALSFMGVQQLEGVFLTHTHKDHIGGAKYLPGYCPVKALYTAEIGAEKKKGGSKLDDVAQDMGLPRNTLSAGDKIEAAPGVFFEVLGPLVYNTEDDNDNSLVLRLRAGGLTFLFTGDMQYAEEETLLVAGVDLSADILKVGNHGNPDATSRSFAKAVSPSLAVISTDTMVDADSASERVKAALDGAEIHLTEQTDLGVLITAEHGEYQVGGLNRPEAERGAWIESIDQEKQLVTLVGDPGKDIGGWFIRSVRNGDLFVLPGGTKIPDSGRLVIACQGGEGDLIWPDKKVWKASKEDEGILFDPHGWQVSSCIP